MPLVWFLRALLLALAAHHVMVLSHEWSHSSVAALLGFKRSFLQIHYGNWSLLNVDEDVDYDAISALLRLYSLP